MKAPDFDDGGKVVSLMHRPSLPPGVFWYLFLEAESTPGHMVPSVNRMYKILYKYAFYKEAKTDSAT